MNGNLSIWQNWAWRGILWRTIGKAVLPPVNTEQRFAITPINQMAGKGTAGFLSRNRWGTAMLIVVGQPFSSQWDRNPPHEPGQCRVCQQKDATRWTTDHVYIMGRKRLPGMTGELCNHCSHFKASEESQKTMKKTRMFSTACEPVASQSVPC